jgi:crotonobetainyl-CoA:carnitine CoA-transferase CaiB-like acyl-CoA transferase
MARMTSPAGSYAQRLLSSVGRPGHVDDATDPVADWAGSGAMALTGRQDGPPLVCTGPVIALRGALLALSALGATGLPGTELLAERAALTGAGRRGDVSSGGATRLLAARDGTVALSLAREDDLALLPALVEDEVTDPWTDVAAWARVRAVDEVRERGALLGLPLGVVGEVVATTPWQVSHEHAGPRPDRPLVVDLTSLWAGPLCASLLTMLGCRVLKVEDPARPDGARRGPPAFFDLLHAGAELVELDLRSDRGRAELQELVRHADVVLEGSRPRALRQLGVVAEDVVSRHDLTWVSITAYGREHDRVGFGDDAAAAGGLLADGCFVADAVADPLTGVHAALAAWAGIVTGGGRLVDVALSRVAATAAGLSTGAGARVWQDGGWWVATSQGPVPVAAPHGRPA